MHYSRSLILLGRKVVYNVDEDQVFSEDESETSDEEGEEYLTESQEEEGVTGPGDRVGEGKYSV